MIADQATGKYTKWGAAWLGLIQSGEFTMWRTPMSCFALGVALVLGMGTTGASAADPSPAVTRADLAAAYLRLERAYFANPPQGERIAEINRAFDGATLAFFTGRNAEAVRTIDELTDSLADRSRSPAERAAVSLKVLADPPVWRADTDRSRTLRIASIYDWNSAEPIDAAYEVRIRSAAGKTVANLPVGLTLGPGRKIDERLAVPASGNSLSPGLYQIDLATADGKGVLVGRVNVVAGSLEKSRQANAERLSQIEAKEDAMEQALVSCRARNELLTNQPSEVNSAQFLADLNALATSVASETAALEAGENPYRRRVGDYWRSAKIGKREIPLRVYAPAAVNEVKPIPLVVVLHGMGGDENMFFEAYGAGVIKQLAETRGILVASPLTYSFGSDIRSLESLVEILAREYEIDPRRVYVLGHSLGAGAAASLARGHDNTIAAACCIAGGNFSATPGTPPTLAVIPELDGVVPPARVRSSAEKAAAAGVPVEVREMPGYGHTLAVGIILPEAIDWLLTHTRDK